MLPSAAAWPAESPSVTARRRLDRQSRSAEGTPARPSASLPARRRLSRATLAARWRALQCSNAATCRMRNESFQKLAYARAISRAEVRLVARELSADWEIESA